MMDVEIGEVHSTVHATDPQALLSPLVLEQIVRAVLERWRSEQGRAERAAQDCRLTDGVRLERGTAG